MPLQPGCHDGTPCSVLAFMNTDPIFETHRQRLFSLAYRLLGSPADAEDVVQEAWLRWHGADRDGIRDPEAWLVTAATRLGLDRLRAAKSARTDYIGPWLPEPLSIGLAPDPAEAREIAGEVSLAFLALLERLGPEERAAFLLKEAFDYDYAVIGEWLGHTEANCRQLVHRARERLRAGRPRFAVPRERHQHLLQRFMEASQNGDRAAITALLADDARCWGPSASPGCTGRYSSARRSFRRNWAGSMANRRSCVSRMAGCIR